MRKILLYVVAITSLTGCNDATTRAAADASPGPDLVRLAGNIDLDGSVTTDLDAQIDLDAAVPILQPHQAQDAAPDALPPPVCEPLGLREPCELGVFLGPCAQGMRVCNLTRWSQCSQVNLKTLR